MPASTIAANVGLGANQTWTNNSSNPLTVSGGLSGGGALTVTVAVGGQTVTAVLGSDGLLRPLA